MNRFLRLTFLLTLVLTGVSAFAATYPITIMGTQVTDANKNNVLYDYNVSYNPETNTLTFDGERLTYDRSVITIGSGMTKDLYICFRGKNFFTSTGSHVITNEGNCNLILYGMPNTATDPSLSITAEKSGYNGIDIIGGGNLKIERLDLTVNSSSTAIGTHMTPTTEKLILDKSNVTLHGDRSAVKFKSVELRYSHYESGFALNGANSEGRGTFNGTVMQDVKASIDVYNIYVRSIQVTAKNASSVLGDSDPRVSYDPDNNELTLNNVSLASDSKLDNMIFVNNSHEKQFKLKLVGNNTITHKGYSYAIYLQPLTSQPALVYSATGDGALTVESQGVYGPFYSGKQNVTFRDCTISAKATNSQAVAFAGTGSTVYEFNGANFTAEAAGSNVCAGVGSLAFTNCYMQTPSDGFISGNHYLVSSGSTNKLVIVKGKDIVPPNFYYGDAPVASNITAYSVRLDFKMAMDNKTPYDKLTYHVDVRKDSSTGKLVQSYDLHPSLTSTALNATLGDLEPNTKYCVTIRVTDEEKNRSTYKDVVFTTQSNARPTVPTNRTLTCKAGATSIDVRWNPASDDWTPANKLVYNVEYKVKTATGWQVTEVGNVTSYTITGLQPNTTYLINVGVEDESWLLSRYQEIEVKTLADTDAVESIATDGIHSAKVYNLQGIEVNANYKGIVIINGKKQLRK